MVRPKHPLIDSQGVLELRPGGGQVTCALQRGSGGAAQCWRSATVCLLGSTGHMYEVWNRRQERGAQQGAGGGSPAAFDQRLLDRGQCSRVWPLAADELDQQPVQAQPLIAG